MTSDEAAVVPGHPRRIALRKMPDLLLDFDDVVLGLFEIDLYRQSAPLLTRLENRSAHLLDGNGLT